jgi:hypothetical protein
MGDLEDCVSRLLNEHRPSYKLFWGAATGLSLGVGLLYSDVTYPLIDASTGRYDTVAGTILVLTHECDVSPDNARGLNEELLICPLIPFAEFMEEYVRTESIDTFKNSFVPSLSRDEIYRVMYLPPFETALLPQGALIYLNQICSTHVSMFAGNTAVQAISAPGLEKVDRKIRNHLFRPKAEILPFTNVYMPDFRRER